MNGNSCLDWCINLGLEPLWMITKSNNNDIDNSYNYSKDNVNIAFECFKIVLNSKSPDINRLVNTTMKDGFQIIDVCAIIAGDDSYHSQFFRYLMNNDGKLNWKIDFNKSLVPTFAAFFGDYVLLRKLLTKEIKSIESYIESTLDGFKKRDIISSSSRYGRGTEYYLFPGAKLNNSEILQRFQRICREKKWSSLSSLLFWCMQEDSENNVNTNDDICVWNLLPFQQELLCYGYLRTGGIEYPDNIASILTQYFDKTIGNLNRFKYLFTNFGDQIDAYANGIHDCRKRGNEAFLKYVYDTSRYPDESLREQNRFIETNNCIKKKSVIHTACKDSDYERFKLFVDLIANDKKFDINQIYTDADLVLTSVHSWKRVDQGDNFKVFKFLWEHKDINIDSGVDWFIQCICWVKTDMVKYLIENNGKYKQRINFISTIFVLLGAQSVTKIVKIKLIRC